MKILLALSALLGSLNAFADQERFKITATIEQVSSIVVANEKSSFQSLQEASSPRGKYAVGDILTGYIQYDLDLSYLIPVSNAQANIYVADTEIFYKSDNGFGYTNKLNGVATQNLISIVNSQSPGTSPAVTFRSDTFWGRDTEYTTYSFTDPTATAFVDSSANPQFNLQDLPLASISYWWLGDFNQRSYSFSAKINSVMLVPEPPAWVMFLAGLAIFRVSFRKLFRA